MSGGILLIGANPVVRLFDGDRVTAFASVWVVDWSVRGSGTALVLWHDGEVRVLGEDPDLARWLESDFTRHFPEVAGLPWPPSTVERTPVGVSLDLDKGMLVVAGNITVTALDILDRRTFATDAFDLGGVSHGLSLVVAPVRTAGITIAGRPVAGDVTMDGTPERPSSSAFLTGAEVWTRG